MEIIVGDRQSGKTNALVQLAIQDGPLARICVYCQPEKRHILEQYGKPAQGWSHGTGQLNNDQVIVLQRPEQLHGCFQTEAGEVGLPFRYYIDNLEKILGKLLPAQIAAVSLTNSQTNKNSISHCLWKN